MWKESREYVFQNLNTGGEDEINARAPQWTAQTTLRASLFGTFLLTLPDLVMPLKGHSLSTRSCPATWSVPSKTLGTNMTVEAT